MVINKKQKLSNTSLHSTFHDTCTGGSFQAGYCDGSADRKCCLKDDYMCTNAQGTCLDSSTQSCANGHFVSGYCTGGTSRKCCVPGSAGTCPLFKYPESAYIYGYYHDLMIEDQFRPSMKIIEDAAKKF